MSSDNGMCLESEVECGEECSKIQILKPTQLLIRKVHLSFCPDFLFFAPELRFTPKFDLNQLLSSLNFSHDFVSSGRRAAFFGTVAYQYGHDTCHIPRDTNSNPYIAEMFTFVLSVFPDMKLNSCLINYYPNSDCTMPFHSDNERCIASHSFVVTLSLGAERTMFFKLRENRSKNVCKGELCSIKLAHGSILVFSRASQSRFVHGLPKEHSPASGPRISATFRRLVR